MKDSEFVICTSGVLTAEILDNAFKVAENNFGKPDVLIPIPQKMFNAYIEWQKWENWVKTLPKQKEHNERTRYRLKHRVKHLPVNLPN